MGSKEKDECANEVRLTKKFMLPFLSIFLLVRGNTTRPKYRVTYKGYKLARIKMLLGLRDLSNNCG